MTADKFASSEDKLKVHPDCVLPCCKYYNMPKLMVHPQLLSMLPGSQETEPSELSVLPHIVNPFGTSEGAPSFFMVVLDAAATAMVVQGPVLLSNTIHRATEDFPDAGLIISALGLPMSANEPLGRVLAKQWAGGFFSFFSFNSETELRSFLACLLSIGSRPARAPAGEVGLHTKHKSGFCSNESPWVSFLKCIPGVTEQKAKAIAKTFPSAGELLRRYVKLDPKQGRKLLTQVRAGATQIGELVSTKVYQALLEEDEYVFLR